MVTLLLPLGSDTHYPRCGNSNGKMILKLLLTLAIGEARECSIPDARMQ